MENLNFRNKEIENDPDFTPPKSTAQLLSAARREFINRKAYDGPQMLALSMLFDAIAREVYGTRFQWSKYNQGQWDNFVSLSNGAFGGALAFSMEPDGNYDADVHGTTNFKGLYVGGPVGHYPYAMEPLISWSLEGAVDKAIAKAGYTRSR